MKISGGIGFIHPREQYELIILQVSKKYL